MERKGGPRVALGSVRGPRRPGLWGRLLRGIQPPRRQCIRMIIVTNANNENAEFHSEVHTVSEARGSAAASQTESWRSYRLVVGGSMIHKHFISPCSFRINPQMTHK